MILKSLVTYALEAVVNCADYLAHVSLTYYAAVIAILVVILPLSAFLIRRKFSKVSEVYFVLWLRSLLHQGLLVCCTVCGRIILDSR